MSQKLKVVTIGGGSSYTPELLEGFLKRYHELPSIAARRWKAPISSPPSCALASLRRARRTSVSR